MSSLTPIDLTELDAIIHQYSSAWRKTLVAGVAFREDNLWLPSAILVTSLPGDSAASAAATVHGEDELPSTIRMFREICEPDRLKAILLALLHQASIEISTLSVDFRNASVNRAAFMRSQGDDHLIAWPAALANVAGLPRLFIEGPLEGESGWEERYEEIDDELKSDRFLFHSLADASSQLIDLETHRGKNQGLFQCLLGLPIHLTASVDEGHLQYELHIDSQLAEFKRELRYSGVSPKGSREFPLQLPHGEPVDGDLVIRSAVTTHEEYDPDAVALLLDGKRVESVGIRKPQSVTLREFEHPPLRKLALRGLLSFGPASPALELENLNVFIGPNASGKSNLIEAIDLLRSAPTKLTRPIRSQNGGGVTEWLWKGATHRQAYLQALVHNAGGRQALRHVIEFGELNSRFELTDERVENEKPYSGHDDVYFYYRFQRGSPLLNARDRGRRQLERRDVALDESILSQIRDPNQYPELTYLQDLYQQFKIYRNWSFGRASVFRGPQSADLPGHPLEENFSNFGLFLSYLEEIPEAKNKIISCLKDLYHEVEDFGVRIREGTVEVLVTERDFVIPASRLSDGTLRYLCLLAILCDPHPPALICIEEPELGLHPDLLPKVADLLVAASESTQLVVTTHSDILVDSLTEQPESVVVVEKESGQTVAKRLSRADLEEWLSDYRLGELWTRGYIGGVRW